MQSAPVRILLGDSECYRLLAVIMSRSCSGVRHKSEIAVSYVRVILHLMKVAALLILLASACVASSRCPDPKLREVTIGGNTIRGGVVLRKNPVTLTRVRVYSLSGKTAWTGKTDNNGRFASGKLPAGDYRIQIQGWGSTTIHLNPEIDKQFSQKPAWELLFGDDACVAFVQIMN